METTLHIRVINNKLTPDLPKYLDIARGELEFAWHEEVPQPHGKSPLANFNSATVLIVTRLDRSGYPTNDSPAGSAHDSESFCRFRDSPGQRVVESDD